MLPYSYCVGTVQQNGLVTTNQRHWLVVCRGSRDDVHQIIDLSIKKCCCHSEPRAHVAICILRRAVQQNGLVTTNQRHWLVVSSVSQRKPPSRRGAYALFRAPVCARPKMSENDKPQCQTTLRKRAARRASTGVCTARTQKCAICSHMTPLRGRPA